MEIDNQSIREFITKQKDLIEIEKQEEQEQLRELLKTTSMKDLIHYGLSISHLKVVKTRIGMFDRPMITLRKKGYEKFKNTSEKFSDPEFEKLVTVNTENNKISAGDVISIYEYSYDMNYFQGAPVLSGTVDFINKFKIVIMCGNNQDVDVYSDQFKSGSYTIVQMVNDVTFKRYIKSLDRLKFYSDRRELDVNGLIRVLFDIDNSENFVDDSSAKMNFCDKRLNQFQRQAVRMALACKHFGLIHGPPGTGKTKTVCEIIKQLCERKQKLLVTASSNIAVDNIIERIFQDKETSKKISMVRVGNPSRVLESSHNFSIHFLVYKAVESSPESKSIKRDIFKLKQRLKKLSKGAYNKEVKREKSEIYGQIRQLGKELNNIRIQITNEIFDKANVIFSTQTSCLDKKLENWLVNSNKISRLKKEKKVSSTKGFELTQRKFFDVAILDEAAQSMKVSSWIPILMSKKCILAGDHKQLPPTVKSKEAEKKGLGETLFSNLSDLCEEKYPGLKVLLKTQYRMNSEIMNLSSRYIYDNQLIADSSCKDHNLTDFAQTTDQDNLLENLKNCIIWVDTSGFKIGDDQENNDGGKPMPNILATASRFNKGEVEIVRHIYRDLRLEQKLSKEDIGVISPYRAQVELIREKLRQGESENFGVIQEKKIDEEKKNIFEESSKVTCCEVSTVDGFQGREKEVIVLSLVRANPKGKVGFLSDERRMNVAITRAKRLLVIVGEALTTSKQKFISSIFEYIKENGMVIGFHDFMNSVSFDGQDSEVLRGFQKSGSYLKSENFVKKNKEKEEGNEEGKKRKKKKKKKKKKKEEDEGKIGNYEIQEKPVVPSFKSPVDVFREEQRGHLSEFAQDGSKTEMTFKRNFQPFQKEIYTELCKEFSLNVQYGSKGINTVKKKQVNNSPSTKNKDNINEEKDHKETHVKVYTINELESMNPEDLTEGQKKKLDKGIKKREKRRRQKLAKQKRKQEAKEEREKIDKMTEEEFLDYKTEKMEEIRGPVGFCPFVLWDTGKKCLKNVKLTGIKCKYCLVTYCMKHAFPEFHGCDEAVDKEAREKFEKKTRKNIGGPQYIPDMDDREKAIQLGKLRKKIAESKASRVQKMKKKGKKGKKKKKR